MKETICNFGADSGLFGILTSPDKDIEVSGAPTMIILNAGIVHRVGPFRIHVDVARMMASHGYSTLRIDLAGLGDSAPRTGKFDTDERALLDVREAMDFLKSDHGVDSFVLVGLCSGAYEAHRISVKDRRVVGAAFLDGIVFPTFGFWLRNQKRFFKPRFWRNAMKRRLLARGKTDERDGQSLAESEFFGGDLCQETTAREIRGMLDREMQLLFLYTDGYDDVIGVEQFQEMYGLQPGAEELQVEYYSKAEHTFRLIENRKIACERIVDWFKSRFSNSVLAN
jgi:pimeloyl-ACP methyl ester carboxylesterase